MDAAAQVSLSLGEHMQYEIMIKQFLAAITKTRVMCVTAAVILLNSSLTVCSAANLALDKKIVESCTFSRLLPPTQWDPNEALPTDSDQLSHNLHGVTPLERDRHRAKNLASSRHFAESIKEWTKIIDGRYLATLDGDSGPVDDLIERALLYKHIGLQSEALADVQEAARQSPLDDEERLSLAALAIGLEANNLAETLLAGADKTGLSNRPIQKYVLAVAQNNSGKVVDSLNSFTEAATLFAIDGSTVSAQACLDAASLIRKNGRKGAVYKLSNLTPPKSNFKATLNLLEAFATRSDIFERNVLENLEARGTSGTSGQPPVTLSLSKHSDANQGPKPKIEKLADNGARISLWLDPQVCVLNLHDLRHVLPKPLPEYNKTNIRYVGSKVYKVPAGLLVLVSKTGGFNALWLAEVYSHDAAYPQPLPKVSLLPDNLNDPFFKWHIGQANPTILKALSGVVERTLQKDPNNVQARAYEAEIAAKQNDLERALTAINRAIELRSAQPQSAAQVNAELGDKLLMQKGNYFLEQKKFVEALKSFEQAFPKKPEADQLFQRAKAEIGTGQLDIAKKDLANAAERYYYAGRIARRDEALQLLAELDTHNVGKSIDAKAGAAGGPRCQTMDDERRRALEFVRAVHAETQLKYAETISRQRKLINAKCADVLFSMPEKTIEPFELTETLVNFATCASDMKQNTAAQAIVDKAIASFTSYSPISEYDQCTVALIRLLAVFPDDKIDERLRSVATRVETFCDDENCRARAEEAFADLIRKYPEKKQIVLLRMVKDIREKKSNGLGQLSENLQRTLDYLETQASKTPPTNFFPAQVNCEREQIMRNGNTPEVKQQLEVSLAAISKMEQLIEQIANKSAGDSNLVADWKSYVHELDCEPKLKQMLASSGCLAIAKAYLQKSEPKSAAASIHAALENIVNQFDANLNFLEKSLAGLRSAAELEQDYVLAETEYEYALKVIVSAKIDDPNVILELKFSLAELLMNHERALPDGRAAHLCRRRAEELIDECNSAQLNIETSAKAKLAVRRLVATKYPALQKLDLPHGEIIYLDVGPDKQLNSYVEIGHRGFIGRGPIEITLGKTTEIVIDGRPLVEKSVAQLNAGNVVEAEKILIAALRAKPTSNGFALLSLVWLLKNEKSDASQACSLALDMERRNAMAVALRQLTNANSSLSKDDRSILQAAISKNSREHKITQALCMVALDRKMFDKKFTMQDLQKIANSNVKSQ